MDPGYRENKNSKVSLPWNMILLLPVNIDKKNDIMFFQAWSRIKLTNPMVVHIVWLMAAEIGFFFACTSRNCTSTIGFAHAVETWEKMRTTIV